MRRVVVVGAVVLLAACSQGSSSPTSTLVPDTSASTETSFRTSSSSTTQPSESTTTIGGESTTTTGSTATTVPPLDPLRALAYEPVAELDFPIIVVPGPGDAPDLLAQKNGTVRSFAGGEVGDPLLDIGDQITSGGERGLLGMAIHPTDPGRLFLYYTDREGDSVLSEFAFDGRTADPGSEQVLLAVDQPASNHNGGMIQFGPDGALYLGLGDGGGGGDEFGNGQNLDTLLGGIVRIDVDTAEAELWQYGLRNPWRFWIEDDDIWIADVGQRSYEEINLDPITTQGLNFGWPITEGLHCFRTSECDTNGLTMPIVEVERGDAGSCSITGGVVYRGSTIPELDGRFLFSDYCGGYLRSTDRQGSVTDHTGDVGVPGQVVSFGVDSDGEVYVLTPEQILKLVAVR